MVIGHKRSICWPHTSITRYYSCVFDQKRHLYHFVHDPLVVSNDPVIK